MNTQLTRQQVDRLTELHDANRSLMQVIERSYVMEGDHHEALEDALGHLYAVAGRMAIEQDISWTGLCQCAEHHYDEEQ